MDDLPEGWVEVPSGEGDFYYWNEDTDEVTWDRPVVERAPPPPPPPAPRAVAVEAPAPIPPRPVANALRGAPLKPAKPAKPARPTSPMRSQPPSVAASVPINTDVNATLRQMQNAKERMAAEDRQAQLRQAQMQSQAMKPVSTAPITNYRFHEKQATPQAVSELKLGTGVRAPARTPAPILPSSPTFSQSLAAVTSGIGNLGLSAANIEARFPVGEYPAVEDSTLRLRTLQILANGTYNFDGKRLHREGPLLKRNRDGNKIYQFMITDNELLYFEPVGAKERFELHHAFPLATLRVRPMAEDEPAVAEAFTILNPTKSFVVRAADVEAKREWLQIIDARVKATCSKTGEAFENPNLIMAAVWRSNNDVKACMICNTAFGMFNRRHHCRACGSVVCANCSSQRLRLEHIDKDQFVRVCRTCYGKLKKDSSYGSSYQYADRVGATTPPPAGIQAVSLPRTVSSPPMPRATSPPRSASPPPMAMATEAPQPVMPQYPTPVAAAGPGPAPPVPRRLGPAPPAPTRPAPPVPKRLPPEVLAGAATHNTGGGPSAGNSGGGATYSLTALQAATCPPGVDPKRKEMSLSDQEFNSLFGMDKASFDRLPSWQKDRQKKAHGLF